MKGFNRETKAYLKNVRAAVHIVSKIYYYETFDERSIDAAIAERFPGAPRYFVDDALAELLRAAEGRIEWSEYFLNESKLRLDRARRIVDNYQRRRVLRVVPSAA